MHFEGPHRGPPGRAPKAPPYNGVNAKARVGAADGGAPPPARWYASESTCEATARQRSDVSQLFTKMGGVRESVLRAVMHIGDGPRATGAERECESPGKVTREQADPNCGETGSEATRAQLEVTHSRTSEHGGADVASLRCGAGAGPLLSAIGRDGGWHGL